MIFKHIFKWLSSHVFDSHLLWETNSSGQVVFELFAELFLSERRDRWIVSVIHPELFEGNRSFAQ